MKNGADTFIILSVINHSSSKLSYSETRSIYGTKERIEQTKKSVQSIRDCCPNSRIILVEIGQKDYSNVFKEYTDSYFFLGKKFLVRKCTDSKFKGLGEAIAMFYSVRYLNKKEDFLVFKLSGRYFLNENFNRKLFLQEKINFKFSQNSVSTRLYAFSIKKIKIISSINIFIIFFLLTGISIERLYYLAFKIMRIKINHIETLGVSGLISVNGELISE